MGDRGSASAVVRVAIVVLIVLGAAVAVLPLGGVQSTSHPTLARAPAATAARGTGGGVRADPPPHAVRSAEFPVRFTETGLPSGTNWSVTFNGTTAASITSSIAFTAPNATYPYTLGSVAHFSVAPANGVVVVSGAPVNVSANYRFTYPVLFQEDNLPAGAQWYVNFTSVPAQSLAPANISSNGTQAFVQLVNGSYSITRQTSDRNYYALTGVNQSFTSGPTLSVGIAFVLSTSNLTFSETGLPTGTAWNASVDGVIQSSNGTTITFDVGNGSHTYLIEPTLFFDPSPAGGTVTTTGVARVIPVIFHVARYPAIFTATGLPVGASWSVRIGAETVGSTSPSLTFGLANGTFDFTALGTGAYLADRNGSGSFVIRGAPVQIGVGFSYSVTLTFGQSGVPSGENWTVQIVAASIGANWTDTAPGPTIAFVVPANQTYTYTISVPSGYSVNVSRGSIRVGDTPVTVPTTVSPTPSAAFPWTYVLIGVGIAIVAGGIGVVLWQRRRPKSPAPDETPPPV